MPSAEIINQAVAIAGYSAGQFLDMYYMSGQDKNAAAITEAAEVAVTAQQAEQRHGMRRFIGNRVLAPMACIGFGAAGLISMYATNESDVIYPQPTPKLEMVVDHSGATQLPLGGAPTVDRINSLAGEFVSKDIKGEALVASDGRVKSTTITKIPTMEPFGDAPLEEATGLGLDKSGSNGSVLVLTNGNSLGNTEQLAKQAEKVNAKVFVVNIEDAKAGSDLSDEKKLARETGGKYWNANQTNLEEVANDVQDTLEPATTKPDNSFPWQLVEFGGAIAFGMAGFGRRIRKGTYASLKSRKGE